MTDEQRWVMAEALLESSWKADGVKGFPTDGRVTSFRWALSLSCDHVDLKVWPASVAVYETDPAAFSP